MPFSERVCWAVGGMVLTAGLFFTRLDYYLVCGYDSYEYFRHSVFPHA